MLVVRLALCMGHAAAPEEAVTVALTVWPQQKGTAATELAMLCASISRKGVNVEAWLQLRKS